MFCSSLVAILKLSGKYVGVVRSQSSLENCSYHGRGNMLLWNWLDWNCLCYYEVMISKIQKHTVYNHYHQCQDTKHYITPKKYSCVPVQLIPYTPPGLRQPFICFLCLSSHFKEFSVSLVFSNLSMICLSMGFFGFVLDGNAWILWIYVLKLKVFQPLFL